MLGVIPARKGSKGLPRKNVKILNGKPLIQYTLEAALESKNISRLIVTTDDDEVADFCRSWQGVEVPFKRPSELASDRAIVIESFFHLLDWLEQNENLEPESFCVLQPTSPLRIPEDIDGAIDLFNTKKAAVVLSMYETKPLYWLHYLDRDCRLEKQKNLSHGHSPMNARQEQPQLYAQNGAVHVFNTQLLRLSRSYYGEGTFGYVMPKSRSIDIDTITDFKIAEALLKKSIC